jgi:hypothetical protein
MHPTLIVSSFLILLISFCSGVSSQVRNLRTIGTSISQGKISTDEQNVFQYLGRGVMTYLWYTGGYSPIEETIFTYYIDENRPTAHTIQFSYFLALGIGWGDQTAPWGTSKVGKGAATGAGYHTYRIPFEHSIRVTVKMPPGENIVGIPVFYVVLRGIAGQHAVTIGDHLLPENAHLYLYKNVNVTLKPLDFINLFSTNRSGAVWQVTLSVRSGNLNFLEGCVRAYSRDPQTGKEILWLMSSGTEDYFQSAYYFNANMFHFEEAGLTHPVQMSQFQGTLSAYKFHDRDSVFFDKGFRMAWRNGDTYDPQTGRKCTLDTGPAVGSPQQSLVTTYAWVYEW